VDSQCDTDKRTKEDVMMMMTVMMMMMMMMSGRLGGTPFADTRIADVGKLW